MIKLQDVFWMSILGTVWRIFVNVLALVKSQHTVIYTVFAPLVWKKFFLQHAENCVYQCFC